MEADKSVSYCLSIIYQKRDQQNHPVNYSGISDCLVMSPLRFGALSLLGLKRGASTLLEEEVALNQAPNSTSRGEWEKEASLPS